MQNMDAAESQVRQVTHEYRNSALAQADMARQSARGLRVVSVTSISQSAGLARWLLIGWLALIFKPQPRVLVVYEGKVSDLIALERGKQELIDQVRAQEKQKQVDHMATLSPLLRWLHTPLGALVTVVVFVLAIVLGNVAHMDAPYLLVVVSIALAIIDWQNFHTFHGSISWKVWKAEGNKWAYWGLGTLLWLYGWLFMPIVYAYQAWRWSASHSEATPPLPADRGSTDSMSGQ